MVQAINGTIPERSLLVAGNQIRLNIKERTMKTTKLLASAMAATMIMATPAFAETAASESTSKKIERSAEKAGAAVKDTYYDIKGSLLTEDTVKQPDSRTVIIHSRMTADGIIGQDIVNSSGEKLGTVKDIILTNDGKADAVIISHGGLLGIGDKEAAFDYGLVMRREQNGDVVMPLSEDSIKQAKAFSYDRKDQDDSTRVIPENGISVNDLLKASLLDHTGKTVAKVDNLYFSQGQVSRVIVNYNQTAGMGGEKALIDYKRLKLARVDGEYRFQMSANQSQQFENFEKAEKASN